MVLGGGLARLCLPPAHRDHAQTEGCLPGLSWCCGGAIVVPQRWQKVLRPSVSAGPPESLQCHGFAPDVPHPWEML